MCHRGRRLDPLCLFAALSLCRHALWPASGQGSKLRVRLHTSPGMWPSLSLACVGGVKEYFFFYFSGRRKGAAGGLMVQPSVRIAVLAFFLNFFTDRCSVFIFPSAYVWRQVLFFAVLFGPVRLFFYNLGCCICLAPSVLWVLGVLLTRRGVVECGGGSAGQCGWCYVRPNWCDTMLLLVMWGESGVQGLGASSSSGNVYGVTNKQAFSSRYDALLFVEASLLCDFGVVLVIESHWCPTGGH